MFSRLRNLFSRSSDTVRSVSANPRSWLRAKYDAAQTNEDNRRHWANADSLSAASANNPLVRRVLRNRARYEVHNNCYARGIVNTLANDVVGTGPDLQLQLPGSIENDTRAQRVELAFQKWAKSICLAEKIRTMRKARAQDGEAFAIITFNPKIPGPIKLDLRLVESEMVCDPDLLTKQTNQADGIRYDGDGNPTEYHVLRNHPGDAMSGPRLVGDWIEAKHVIHWFRSDRPGQIRGIPELTPALPLFAQLRRYTLAVIAAAETAADFAGILHTAGAADSEGGIEPWVPIEIEQRALLTLPDGYDLSQLKAEQPTTTYAAFKAEIINEIGRCMDMPFNIAAANSSNYNYASGRMDHQVYFRMIGVDQASGESVILDPLLMAWMDEAALIPGLLPDAGPYSDWNHSWMWPGREHVDPAKEANAQKTRLASLTTSLAREYSRQGLDWQTEIEQIARERATLSRLGLSLSDEPPQSAAENENDDDETEETEEANTPAAAA